MSFLQPRQASDSDPSAGSSSTSQGGDNPGTATGLVSNGDGITIINPVEEFDANTKTLIGLWIFFGCVCFIVVFTIGWWLRRKWLLRRARNDLEGGSGSGAKKGGGVFGRLGRSKIPTKRSAGGKGSAMDV